MLLNSSQLARTRHCTCSALRRASRAVTAHYEAHFRGSELRGTQFTILSNLAQTGPLSMTQLSGQLGVDRTTLTRNLSVLARRGLVAYTGARDARVHKAEITRDGIRALQACMPHWIAAQKSVGSVLKKLKLTELSRSAFM
jgi:DNA-binding MarR family transcriptional regulator